MLVSTSFQINKKIRKLITYFAESKGNQKAEILLT